MLGFPFLPFGLILDQPLSPHFEATVVGDGIDYMSTGFFVKDDVLVRKWAPPCSFISG